MSRDSFYKDTIVLTSSNLITGVLRFLFSILLSRKLGSEALGLYSLVMPVYDFFCCLTSGGLITALSKEAASNLSNKDYRNLNKSIHITVIFEFIWSLLFAIILIILSPLISNYVVKDSRTLHSLWIIAPALIAISISAVYKGYFFGVSKVKIPAFIDIFEKTIRMIAIIGIIGLLRDASTSNTVAATYLALTVGEFLSLFLLYIYYKFSKLPFSNTHRVESKPQLLFNILTVAFPLCLNGVLTTLLAGLSTLIIPRRLLVAGISYGEALAMIGKFSGMAISIVFFPMVIISSISTILTPDISKSNAAGNYNAMEKRIKDVLKISLLIGISNLLVCLCIPDSLGYMFFGRNDIGDYIRVSAISAPFIYIFGSSTGILNGLGKQNVVLRNSLITSVLQIILFYILIGIPKINIYGYGITMLIVSVLSCILNLYELLRDFYLPMNLGELLIDSFLIILYYYILKILHLALPDSMMVYKNLSIICIGFSLLFVSLFLNRASRNKHYSKKKKYKS